eukprot:4154937-Pleurochrysis_carterae.AAC.1
MFVLPRSVPSARTRARACPRLSPSPTCGRTRRPRPARRAWRRACSRVCVHSAWLRASARALARVCGVRACVCARRRVRETPHACVRRRDGTRACAR